jgi:hypothetical protein
MKDPLDALFELSQVTDATISNINKLEKALSSGRKALEESKKELSEARNSQHALTAISSSVNIMLAEADDILKESIQIATSESEYSHPAFRTALMSISDDIADAIEIIYNGVGWSSNISVKIDMDSIAGNINDYAEAVEAAREALKVKDTRDPAAASKYWKTKVYGTELYSKTINLRVKNMDTAAPFWSLLNYGTARTSMSSDIGGTPFPRTRGTKFVEKAERALYQRFRSEFLEKRTRNKNLRDTLLNRTRDLTQKIKDAESIVDSLNREYGNIQRAKSLSSRLGVSVTTRDVERIVAAIEQYRNQDRLGSSRVSVGGKRVTVSKLASMDF